MEISMHFVPSLAGAFAISALLMCGSAPAGAAPAAGGVDAAAQASSIVQVRHRRHHKSRKHHSRRHHWRGHRHHRGPYGRHSFRAGHSPYGCYFDEGGGQTDEAKAAYVEAVRWLRRNGAGRKVNGHRDHKSTDCPGDVIYAWLKATNFDEPVAPTEPKLNRVRTTVTSVSWWKRRLSMPTSTNVMTNAMTIVMMRCW